MDTHPSPIAATPRAEELPAYEPPTVTTHTDEQLLEALGPAQAATSYTLPT